MLEIGTKAPDFELPDQNGEVHKLSVSPCLALIIADAELD